jgi:hypothetical protein
MATSLRATPRPGESREEYQRRLRKGSVPQKTPEQLRQDALYTAETKRLAEEAGMPQLETYKGIETLPGGGQLTARQLSGADIQREMEASPWYRMALQKQEAEQATLMDQTARQQAGALAGARSQMAMRGGLRSGAAERMATAGAENVANLMQQQRQAGAVERGQLGMQGADLASRLGQFNVGQQAGTDVTNLQAQIANLAQQENRKMQQYGERMKGYAAERTSQGIGSGGGGGLLSGLFGR